MMKHTQEELANVLNKQRQRGEDDAKYHRGYGYGNESASYPNSLYPDITRKAVNEAYDDGWARQRMRMNKPDAICAQVFGKGVKHLATTSNEGS